MPIAVDENIEQHLARFALTAFRPGQREVIATVLRGQDCLCIMPTGGGKSLCYQLPAVARPGVTLVVSPLIALMQDQVMALEKLGIAATYINSSLTQGEQQQRMHQMAAGEFDLVYIAPERLRHSIFLERLRSVKVQLLAVDEAHCISEWGHDFRPDYARLGKFRERLGFPPTIALTATATPDVRTDVVAQLRLKQPQVFVTGFARPNLHFEVRDASTDVDKLAAVQQLLAENPGSGIIYCATRKRCAELAELLAEKSKRQIGLYHAGLTPEDRRRVQEDFMRDRVQIIIATNAFGMGIDKPDLRFVIHYNMPGNLEAYYQEAGRAGRDGLPSRCLLLFGYQDRFIQEFFIDSHYPPPDVVQKVYDFLRQIKADPIELTLQEIKDQLKLKISTEGIAACEKLLEKCGALERLDSRQNMAAVKIDSDLPTLVDLLPVEAKVQRKVLRAIEKLVGEMRHERVFITPQTLIAATEMDGPAVNRALRELSKLKAFDYVPPFRGRALHMMERKKAFRQLGIDFTELDRRKKLEYDKLDRVVGYAQTRRCRQEEILDYFGDPSKLKCGLCDNCHGLPAGAGKTAEAGGGGETSQHQNDPAVVETVRMALSGVARTKGKVGLGLVAKMLYGSRAEAVIRMQLDRLSTFGLLQHLQKKEVTQLLEELLRVRLLEQDKSNNLRPTVKLTSLGNEVMRTKSPLPGNLQLDALLLAKIRYSAKARPAAVQSPPAPAPPVDVAAPPTVTAVPSPPAVVAALEPAVSQPSPPPLSTNTTQAAPSAEAPIAGPGLNSSHYWTWRIMASGFSLEECQWIRRLDYDKVYNHLLQAARDGHPVDRRWLLTESQIVLLDEVIGDRPLEEVQQLMAKLPSGARYKDVQLYLLTRRPF